MGFRLPRTKGMLRREAAGWLARLQSGRDPDIEHKFRRWRDADPAHAAALDRVRRTYDQAALLRTSPLASDPPVGSRQAPRRTPRYAMAAAVGLVVLIPAGLFVLGGPPRFGGTNAVMLATSVGELRQVTLSDGSKVTLDTATSMEVEINHSRRRARLNQGRARFEISGGSPPFVVEAGATSVTTGQGVIDVERTGPQGGVEVLAGSADVHRSREDGALDVKLVAGEGLAANSSAPEQKHQPAAGPDWTRGMLQFDGTALADAVALANRYSERHIILVGDVSALRVTGAFRAGDTAGLAKALAAAFDLSLEQRGDGNIVLSRTASPAGQNKKGG